MTEEPTCCGEAMVHNSFLLQYECADAYFALIDDGVLSDWGVHLRVEESGLTDYQRERWQHWRASWTPSPYAAAFEVAR